MLTPKQQAFVNEYLIDLNATQAAIRAGYSEKTARQVGSENLSKPYLQEAIEKAKADRASKVAVTAENVLKDILDTRLCLEQAMAENADLKANDIATLSNARSKTNDMLMKHLGEYREKVEHSGEFDVNVTWKD